MNPPKVEIKILPGGSTHDANQEAYTVYMTHLMDVIRVAHNTKDVQLLDEMRQTLAYAKYEVEMMIGDIHYPGAYNRLNNLPTEPENGKNGGGL